MATHKLPLPGKREPGYANRLRSRSVPFVNRVANPLPGDVRHFGVKALTIEADLAQLEWLGGTRSDEAAKPFLDQCLQGGIFLRGEAPGLLQEQVRNFYS